MLTIISPSRITGDLQAPASKSSMQRACAAALLCGEPSVILNPGHSNDDRAALRVIQALGARVDNQSDGSLQVTVPTVPLPLRGRNRLPEMTGDGNAKLASAESKATAATMAVPVPGSAGNETVHGSAGLEVNCGESGLGIRMFAPIIALSDQPIRVVGEGSLLTRPMDFFDEIFPQLGIKVISNKGKLPLLIQGPLQPRDIGIDGSLSSQFLTGLLFAYAAAGAGGVSIRVKNLKSRPYIDLTLQVMRHYGWRVENRENRYEEFYFAPQPAEKPGENEMVAARPLQPYIVEGDWSGGAFLLVAGAVAGKVRIRGLDVQSTQADKAILQALGDSGAFLQIRDRELEIGPPENASSAAKDLCAFRFDATDCPDLFPPLVALASYCKGVTEILGVSRLAHKESNRGLTLQEEFGKMGVTVDLEGDRMLVHGGRGVNGAVVHSRHDHRIAMACAVAGLAATGETKIEEAQAINKSYPDFYGHLQQLGVAVTIR